MSVFILFRKLILSFALLSTVKAFATVSIYQSTDNTGLNKQERLEAIEGFLTSLSKTLKAMEDEHQNEVKKMDELIKAHGLLKEAQSKREALGAPEKKIISDSDVKESKIKEELEVLKRDILILKNDDIEKLKINFQELSDTVKALQASFRSQLEAAEKSESKK